MNRINYPLCLLKVLLKCLMVLQEIPGALKQKRPVVTTESLYHMVACMTHYVAKVIQINNFIKWIDLCQTNPKYNGTFLHADYHSTQFHGLANPVTRDCIAKTKYKVLCVFICVGFASFKRGMHGIFSDGTRQAALNGDEWESTTGWQCECS